MSGPEEQKLRAKRRVGVKVSNLEPDFEANRKELNRRATNDLVARIIFGLRMMEVLDELHWTRYKEEVRKSYKPKLRRGGGKS